MRTDEKEIRELVERWARAVHAGDMSGVVADHAEDIVMFDVPGDAYGMDAYRRSWPGFFRWQASGATFDVVSLEVTTGEDVAYAVATLRCGMPQDEPQPLLRLTLGLRKENGRWLVAHEHHSFPLSDPAGAEREVRGVFARWFEQTAAQDLDGLMEGVAGDVVSWEPGGRYEGLDQVREACRRNLGPGIEWDVPDLEVAVRDDLAVAWGTDRIRVDGGEPDLFRGTRVFRRRGGRWELIQQHLSS